MLLLFLTALASQCIVDSESLEVVAAPWAGAAAFTARVSGGYRVPVSLVADRRISFGPAPSRAQRERIRSVPSPPDGSPGAWRPVREDVPLA